MIIMNILKNPKTILYYLDQRGLYHMDDEEYLKILYKLLMNEELNLKQPKTFNEKLQWLKINDRKTIYTKMVDKYEVKKYISDLIGTKYIIPTIGIYDKFEEINFDELPQQFVIKCTHDSGGNVIVKDKSKLNIKSVRKKINKCLKKNFFYQGREWPYKNVKPRIIIEKYMSNHDESELIDYKFFNFNGIPKIILVCSNRSVELKETWFDEKFNRLEIKEGGHDIDQNIVKPKKLKEMIELSKKISKNIPFVRTDFYLIKNQVYFGEITFYPASGFERFNPEEWNKKMGDLLLLK